MPVELQEADVILGLCDRFKKLPSEIRAESADLLRLLALAERGGLNQQNDTEEGGQF